jgi:hypothetical protein
VHGHPPTQPSLLLTQVRGPTADNEDYLGKLKGRLKYYYPGSNPKFYWVIKIRLPLSFLSHLSKKNIVLRNTPIMSRLNHPDRMIPKSSKHLLIILLLSSCFTSTTMGYEG